MSERRYCRRFQNLAPENQGIPYPYRNPRPENLVQTPASTTALYTSADTSSSESSEQDGRAENFDNQAKSSTADQFDSAEEDLNYQFPAYFPQNSALNSLFQVTPEPDPAAAMATDYTLMPKYDKPLISRDVSLFLRQFKLWGSQQKLTPNALKATLALAFQNEDAKRWCIINADKAANALIDFDEFVKLFMAQAPIQTTSSTADYIRLMSETPKPDELASSYLIRVRYNCGDEWNDCEEDNVHLLIENLPKPLATFINCKNSDPKTFNELLKVVREYEVQGRDTVSHSPSTKQEVTVQSTVANQEFSDMKTLMQVLIREVAEIKSTSVNTTNSSRGHAHQQSRGSFRGRVNHNNNTQRNYAPRCYTCNRTGHLARDCYNNFRGRGRGRGSTRGGGRVFQNSGYYQYTPFPIATPPQQQWQRYPALQQQNQPIITYPANPTGN